jgi:hypothetical protein
MKRHVIASWCFLLYFDFIIRFRGFDHLHRVVRRQAVRSRSSERKPTKDQLCHSVDLACVLFYRRVLCLQRSAATTVLLRRHGWPAEMVLGARVLPFKSHAWVESEGSIVNDKPYMLDLYQVLGRC